MPLRNTNYLNAAGTNLPQLVKEEVRQLSQEISTEVFNTTLDNTMLSSDLLLYQDAGSDTVKKTSFANLIDTFDFGGGISSSEFSTLLAQQLPSYAGDAINFDNNKFNADFTGLDVKASVRLAVNTNVVLYGTPHRDYTSLGLDSLTLSSGDRVLLRNQTTQSENGIYEFQPTARTFNITFDNPPAGTSSYYLLSGEDRTGTFINQQNKQIHIVKGDTITFTKNGAQNVHPLAVYDKSNALYPDASGILTHTFNTIHTVHYECSSHFSSMRNYIFVSNFIRTADFNDAAEIKGAFTFVEEGTDAGNGFVCTNTGAVTIGTTNISFTQFNAGTTYTAGSGLNLTGTQFSVDLADGTVPVAKLSGTLPASQGGTGAGNLTDARNNILNTLSPSNGHIIKYQSGAWTTATESGGGGGGEGSTDIAAPTLQNDVTTFFAPTLKIPQPNTVTNYALTITPQELTITEPTITPNITTIGGGGVTNLSPPSLVETVSSGLIAHYKFDDDLTDATDPTNSSKNLTSSTAVTYNSDSIYGKSSYLYSNNYLTAPFKLKYLTDIGSFSISFWFKTDPTKSPKDTWNVMWSSSNSAANTLDNRGIRLYLHSDNSLRLYTYQHNAGSTNYQYNNSISNSDTWVFLTTEFTYVSTSGNNLTYNFKLYLDNVLISNTGGSNNQSITFKTNDTENFTIMDDDDNSYPNEVYLDDFRIYNRALSAAEVEKLYLEGSDRGLIAHYKFDDSTDIGKCEIDNATNNLTAATVSIVDGIFNDAADFDGSTSYLKTSAIDLATTNVYSISFWVKFDTAPSGANQFFWSQGSTAGSGTILAFLYEQSNNCLTLSHYGVGNDINSSGYNMTTTLGTQWNFIVATYNDSNSRTGEIYLNGTKLTTNISSMTNSFTGTGDFYIARSQNAGGTIDGVIDDFRIYDRALSAAEVEKLYYAQYIQTGSISNSTDEYIAFKYNPNLYPDIVADFTNATITNLTSWITYGTSIFGNNFTYSLNSYQDGYGVWEGGTGIGWFKIVLPSNYNYIKVEYTNGDSYINTGVANLYIDPNPDSATPLRSILELVSAVYEGYYNIGDILKIQEDNATIKDVKITLSNTQTEYTINFPQATDCEILLLDDTNYNHLETPLESLNGTYTVKVGTTESSISKSGYTKTTTGEVMTPQLLSISGYASWDSHKTHAETNNGRLPYRDEIIEFLDPDRTEPENYTYSQYLNNTSTASTDPYDVWIPVNDYVGAFVEIGKHSSHEWYTLKTPSGTETYLTKDLGTDTPFYTTTAGTSTSSSSIWGNNQTWVPNTNIFYVPYHSNDITGTTQTYSSKEVIIRYATQTGTAGASYQLVTTTNPLTNTSTNITQEKYTSFTFPANDTLGTTPLPAPSAANAFNTMTATIEFNDDTTCQILLLDPTQMLRVTDKDFSSGDIATITVGKSISAGQANSGFLITTGTSYEKITDPTVTAGTGTVNRNVSNPDDITGTSEDYSATSQGEVIIRYITKKKIGSGYDTTTNIDYADNRTRYTYHELTRATEHIGTTATVYNITVTSPTSIRVLCLGASKLVEANISLSAGKNYRVSITNTDSNFENLTDGGYLANSATGTNLPLTINDITQETGTTTYSNPSTPKVIIRYEKQTAANDLSINLNTASTPNANVAITQVASTDNYQAEITSGSGVLYLDNTEVPYQLVIDKENDTTITVEDSSNSTTSSSTLAIGTYDVYVDTAESKIDNSAGTNIVTSTGGTAGTYSEKFKIVYQEQEQTSSSLEPAPYDNTKIDQGAVDTTNNYIKFKYQADTIYKINFSEVNSIEILLLDDSKYIEHSILAASGEYSISITATETKISDSSGTIATTTGGTNISSGYSSDITGTDTTYTSKQVIIKYLTKDVSNYQLPTASTSVKGGVKVDGTTIGIANEVISVNTASTTTTGVVRVDGTTIDINEFEVISVPYATTSSKGVVEVGTGINVNAGVISVTPASVPDATTSSKGLVQIGNNIDINSGEISVPDATTSSKGLVQIGNNIDITSGEISVPDATTSSKGVVQIGNNIDINSGEISVPIATSSNRGVVQTDGDSISIDSYGAISVNPSEFYRKSDLYPKTDFVHHLVANRQVVTLGGTTYWQWEWSLPLNLRFNFYGRNQLNVRAVIGVNWDSPVTSFDNEYWFLTLSYNQGSANNQVPQINTIHKNMGNMSASIYWDNSGGAYLKFTYTNLASNPMPMYPGSPYQAKININI